MLDTVHNDGRPCRFIAGVCNLCGGTPEEVPPALVTGGREWLVLMYRADVDAIVIPLQEGHQAVIEVLPGTEGAQPACRCYRCGALLTAATVRLHMYVMSPACERCAGETGEATR